MVRKVRWEGRRGCPDLVFFGEGGSLWLELKRPDGRGVVSEWQKREIERLRNHDIPAFVIDQFDEAAELLAIHFPDHCG